MIDAGRERRFIEKLLETSARIDPTVLADPAMPLKTLAGWPRAPMIYCRWQYFQVFFTLPAEITQIACWNKRAVYHLPFRASTEMVTAIAADPRRLGVRVGMTAVLHIWGRRGPTISTPI